jgi:homoserine O-acetyltransferase
MSTAQIFRYRQPFTLQNGTTLPEYHLAYHTYGTLNSNGDNVVWIFHALTANSDPLDWWPGLAGEGKLFDPAEFFIVCVNMPGSCYGSIGPLDATAGGKDPYYHSFPFFSIRDMVRAYQPLRVALGIEKIHIGIGGSMGGQQLLEWAVDEPDLFRYIVPVATNAWHSAWGKAFNASQRWCIEMDASWNDRSETAGMHGMQVARSMALLSYRHYKTYDFFQSDDDDSLENFKAASYQRYQGEKLAKRFNAFSYYALSLSMDSHHIGRYRHSAVKALQGIRAEALVIGLLSDILFPLSEQEYLAEHIPHAKLAVIDSMYGHDGFLLEYDAIGKEIKQFIPVLGKPPILRTI